MSNRSWLCKVGATVTSFLLMMGVLVANTSPQGSDGQGISVRLELPWTTLAEGEDIAFRFILENATSSSIPVAIPRNEHGLAVPVGGQPFLSAKWTSGNTSPIQGSITSKPYRVEQAQWPPKHPEGYEVESWTELAAGHRFVWDQSRIYSLYFDINANVPLKSLQGHWLVGPGRWVSSESVAVKVLPIPSSERKHVFDAKWSSYGFGKDSCSGTAYTVVIEGKMFLFWQRARVAEVRPEDRFEHWIDKDATNMEITISGPSGVRKVYVHLRHRCVRDTPWPIGPVSLFAPKPEPIPPAELEALREVDFPSPSTAEARPDKKPGLGVNSNDGLTPVGGNKKRNWFWIWVVSLVTGGILIFRKLRQ